MCGTESADAELDGVQFVGAALLINFPAAENTQKPHRVQQDAISAFRKTHFRYTAPYVSDAGFTR